MVMGSDLDSNLAAAMADTLDGLSAAIFLVDAEGRIVHANMAGHDVLAAGDVLCNAGGRLTGRGPEVDESLRNMFAATEGSDAAIGKGVALPLTARDGRRHVAHVLPLGSGARRRDGAASPAAAAIIIHEAILDASPPEIIAKTFRLTPTELRILLAIVEVGGVPEVAEALGIAETTVRTHLTRLFQKTATGRQADLVKIVAGFSNPLV